MLRASARRTTTLAGMARPAAHRRRLRHARPLELAEVGGRPRRLSEPALPAVAAGRGARPLRRHRLQGRPALAVPERDLVPALRRLAADDHLVQPRPARGPVRAHLRDHRPRLRSLHRDDRRPRRARGVQLLAVHDDRQLQLRLPLRAGADARAHSLRRDDLLPRRVRPETERTLGGSRRRRARPRLPDEGGAVRAGARRGAARLRDPGGHAAPRRRAHA